MTVIILGIVGISHTLHLLFTFYRVPGEIKRLVSVTSQRSVLV